MELSFLVIGLSTSLAANRQGFVQFNDRKTSLLLESLPHIEEDGLEMNATCGPIIPVPAINHQASRSGRGSTDSLQTAPQGAPLPRPD